MATHFNNLAGLLQDTNRLAEVEPLLRRALAIDEAEREPRAVAREARAERYFECDLEDQRRWYGERASRFEARALPAIGGRTRRGGGRRCGTGSDRL